MNLKENWKIILLIFGTISLGSLAVFFTIKIYNQKNIPISSEAIPTTKPTPTPTKQAKQLETYDVSGSVCEIAFSVVTPTPTNTASPTPTATGTPSPTSTPTPTATGTPSPTSTPAPQGCFYQCSQNSDCASQYSCLDYEGTFRCLNATCPSQANCVCTTPTPTPTAGVYPTATPTPEIVLEEAGFSLPTIGAIGGGVLFVLVSLLLVL